jgi:enediyne biosynthesis protein E4
VLKKLLLAAGVFVFLVAILLYLGVRERLHALPAEVELTPFQEIEVAFRHHWERKTTHPFVAAAVLDVDGDGVWSIYVDGGQGNPDALLRYRDGRIVNVIAGTGLGSEIAAYGATAIDVDGHGRTDLLIAQNDGLWLYRNRGGRFEAERLPLQIGGGAVPFGIAVTDLERDGDVDLYISRFIEFPAFRSAVFNDPRHAKHNVLLRNDGGKFTDMTQAAGIAGLQNTFTSVFVDLDGDRREDLVLAQNTGQFEIYRNLGESRFERIPFASGFGFWMGLGVGDYDADGDPDLLLTNVGNSIPAFLTRGDRRADQNPAMEWMLVRNDGGMKFANATEVSGLTGFGFGWGALFEDLDLDGRLDIVAAQNYIKWPLHRLLPLPGKVLLQTPGGGFAHAERLGLDNRAFGQSPLIVDLDRDGRPDVLWINMDGPVRAFLNRTPNRSIAVVLPDNAASLGVRVRVKGAGITAPARLHVTGHGLLTDHSPELFFGLGQHAQSVDIEFEYNDGTVARQVGVSPGARVIVRPRR